MELETARQTFPHLWFAMGLTISGFANFIIVFAFNCQGFLIKTLLVFIGALCINYSWRAIPNAEDLDWLLTLDRLFVITREASLPIMDFKFKKVNGSVFDSDTSERDAMLVAGAITSIESIIGEILANTGGLDEIEYGGRTVIFDRRANFTSMLVAEKSIRELRFRLEGFSLQFESRYGEQIKEYSGNIEEFSDANDLVVKVFT